MISVSHPTRPFTRPTKLASLARPAFVYPLRTLFRIAFGTPPISGEAAPPSLPRYGRLNTLDLARGFGIARASASIQSVLGTVPESGSAGSDHGRFSNTRS